MWDFLLTAALELLPLLMILKIILDWRKSRNAWLWLPAALFLLAAVGLILNWCGGVLGVVLALVVYVILGRVTKK